MHMDLELFEQKAVEADRENKAPPEIIEYLRNNILDKRYEHTILSERLEAVETISRIAPAFASIVLITTSVQYLSKRLGIEELANPGIYAVALTEGGSGSDLVRNIETTAEPFNQHYCLSGIKYYTSNGLYADAHLVLALDKKTGKLELFLSRDLEKIDVEPLELEAFRGAGITKTRYNCAKAEKLTEGTGLKEALTAINLGRLGYAGIGIGIIEGSLEDAIQYTTTRKAFGGLLADLQGVQFMLAEIYTQLYPLKNAYQNEIGKLSATGKVDPVTAATLKNAATQAARRAALINLQLHGGRGLQRGTRTLRLLHDSLAVGIGEGAYEVLQTFIAKKIISAYKS